MKASLRRMYALYLQEYYIAVHTLEVFSDVLAFPIINTILFGLINHYLLTTKQYTSANYLLIGVVLWEIISVNQYSVSLAPLWSIWSRSLSNIFVAPISTFEYLFADIVSALVKSVFVFTIVAALVKVIFNFSIWHIGWVNLLLDFINLAIFGWVIGIYVVALIFRYGTRVQAISWGVIFLFQPLTATFYPVSALPKPLQYVANAMPPTHIFQAARANLTNTNIYWHEILLSFFLNLFYGAIAILIFRYLFNRAKITGKFARNDN